MIPNSEFNFSNIHGKYALKKIVRENDEWIKLDVEKKDYPTTVNDYKYYAIVQTEELGLISVYPRSAFDDNSVLMQFAALDVTNIDSLVEFCNKYGLPQNIKMSATYDTDYIFNHVTRQESYLDTDVDIPFSPHHDPSISLEDITDQIISFRNILALNVAIESKNYSEIVDIITYSAVCEYPYSRWPYNSELTRFNTEFREALSLFPEKQPKTLNKKIERFIDGIKQDTYETETEPRYDGDYSYPQYKHKMWQNVVLFLETLIKTYKIKGFTRDGHTIFNTPVDPAKLFSDNYSSDNLIILARAALVDMINSKLSDIYPEMVFEDGILKPEWHLSSLSSAMATEMYTMFTPYARIKKCSNPTCKMYFNTTTENSRKIYCSTSCAQTMAKRMQRAREKGLG